MALQTDEPSMTRLLLCDVAQTDQVCHAVGERMAYLRVATNGISIIDVWWTAMRLEQRHGRSATEEPGAKT